MEMTITEEEHHAAVTALIDWFESQEINPADAVPVLAETMIHAILTIAEIDNKDPEEGGRIIAKAILKGLHDVNAQ